MFNSGASAGPLSPYQLQEGVASLSRGVYFKEASLDVTLSILTEAAAQMAAAERVSIWALTDDQQELRCLELYQRSSARHRSGGTLQASRYPAYFRALRSGDCIAADDAYRHPATLEFAADYLPNHQITAMLDTPIHIRGELQGVLCFEQVGTAYPWTAEHRLFAHAVANLVTLALVEYEAAQARQQAQEANQRMQAVFDGSRDALLLADGESGIILDANRQAEILFGCPRRQLIGRHQRTLYPAGREESRAGQFDHPVDGQWRSRMYDEILCGDGHVQAVEVSAEVADVSDGRQLVLEIFRPI